MTADTVTLSSIKNQPSLELIPKSELLEDRKKTWNLNEARQQTHWQTPNEKSLNFGFSGSSYWIRWIIVNDSEQNTKSIIDLGNSREDFVTWHLIRNNKTWLTYTTGDRYSYKQRPLTVVRNFVLPLALKPHEQMELYLHLDSFDGFFESIPIKLYTEQVFFEDHAQQSLVLSLYHGGLLFLMLYNLLLFFATKERSFILYVSYLFWFIMWNLTMNGFSFQYLWPDSPAFNNNFLTVCSATAFGLFGFFTIEYLQLENEAPRWLVTLIKILAWLNFSVLILSAVDYYAISVAYGQIVGVAITLVALGAGLWLLIQGQRQARFFMAAFTMLGIGVTAYILKTVGVLPSNFFTTWGLQFGSAFEALILALGLADSMNVMKQQKISAERKARVAQEALANGLENQVKERTQALAKANAQLQVLALTDELTGAYNRRHFNSVCGAVLNQHDRNGPIVFCMLDVDYFKRYNDHYGHSAGDNVLRSIAQSIQNVLQRSGDTLFRLGGEEFGVLFSAKSPESAFKFVEKMRKSITDLNIAHAESPYSKVTASFGLTFWDKEKPRTEHVYTATDEALYTAKAAGRNSIHLYRQ